VSDLKEPATVATESPRPSKTEKPVNEIVKQAAQAKEGEEAAAHKKDDNRTAWIAAGVGVGVGSAALVAALLYANRGKKKD
jgi:hypothetical protein